MSENSSLEIYLASRIERKKELQNYVKELEHNGFIVTSRWITTDFELTKEEKLNAEAQLGYKQSWGKKDLDDLIDAQVFIAFTEEPYKYPTRGGRHVEFGFALAERKVIYVIGPRETIFHTLEDRVYQHYSQWNTEDMIKSLTTLRHTLDIIYSSKHKR